MPAATALMVPVSPLIAARTYLLDELDALGNANKLWDELPIAVVPPPGQPKSYALLSRPGSAPRSLFTTDYLIRVRVFDQDMIACEHNTDLLYALMLAATHHRITTREHGSLWITKASPGDNGPSEFTDPDVQLFGLQFATFWTVAGKPL